jgi:PAS domain S-box-containing protein
MSKMNEPGNDREKAVLFEDFFTSMLNSVTESAFLITPKGIVLAANETVAKRLGLDSGGDLVGRNMYDLLPPEVAESRRSKVQEVIMTGEPVQFEDVRSGRWIHNSIYPVYDSTGGISRLSVFAIDITRQKAQEERLSLLGEMVDRAPASITIHDTGGNFIYVNRETLRLHGYTEEEFMSLNLKDLDVPESAELLEERFRMIAEKGEVSFESAHFHKDGTVIPVLVMAKSLDWKGTSAVMSIATDIRESKKSEQALRESEERFRLLSEVTMEGIVIHKNAIAVDVNSAIVGTLGYSKEEIIGKNLMELAIFEEDRARVKENIVKEYARPYVSRVVKKNGDVFWAEIEARNIELDGEVIRVAAVRDIEDRKKAEDDLRNSEAKFRSYVENAPYGVFITDASGRYHDVNPAAEKITGYSRKELPEIGIPDLIPEDSREAGMDHFARLLETGNSTGEVPFMRKGGERRIWSVSAVKIGDESFLGFVEDVTDRKMAEDRLRENEELIMAVMDNLPLGVAVNSLDPAVEFSYMNDRFWKTYKTSREELSDPDAFWSAVYKDPEFREKIRERVLKDCGSGDPGKMQWDDVPITREGETFFVSARNTPVPGSSLMVSAVWDVTEYKKTEDQLRMVSERLKAIYDHSPLLISEFDREGRYLLVNRAVSELFGLPPRELEGRTFSELLPGKDSEIFMRRTRRVWDTLEPLAVEDTVDIGGVTKHYLTMLFPLYDRDGDINSIGSIAHDITDRKEAEDSLREALGRLRKVTGSVIQVIVMAVETRDPYTAGHQRRVGDLARAIATEMGLSPHDVEGIRIAGVIHDLGKISVPSEILSKPRKLNDTEFAIVKEHPQKGYEILKDVDFDWPVAEMVLQHHERLDGSGYPRGLKDGEILLQARILAVADVVEAMASHRPYRPTLGLEAALEEIASNRGKLYDPEAVDACLNLFRVKGYDLVGV